MTSKNEKKIEVLIETVEKIVASDRNQSQKIRALYDAGMYQSEIAKVLGCRPQTCSNVLLAHVGGPEFMRKKVAGTGTWTAKFNADFEEGLKPSEVARKHNKPDSQVYQAYRKWKSKQ